MLYVSGDVLNVSEDSRKWRPKSNNRKAQYTAATAETARGRVFAALRAAAEQCRPCPSNRELCRCAGLLREADVTSVFRHLRQRKLIEVEWTTPAPGGARRVVIVATGARTDWSLHGPRWGYEVTVSSEASAALGRFLGRRGGHRDVTRAEARAISRRSPPDRGMPLRPETSSGAGCALAGLLRPDPDATVAE